MFTWGPETNVGAALAAALISPTATDITSTSVIVGGTTSVGSGTFFVGARTTPGSPSASDIENGTGFVATDSVAVSAAGAVTVLLEGLSATTDYYLYRVQRVGAEVSNILGGDSITTESEAVSEPAIVGGIDFTAMATSFAPVGTRTSSWLGGSDTTYFPSSGVWLGATEPSCSMFDFPDVLGCLTGLNSFPTAAIETYDPASPTWDAGALFQKLELSFVLQIRPFTTTLVAYVAMQQVKIEFDFHRTLPRSEIRIYLGTFGDELAITAAVTLETTALRTLRLELGAATGSPFQSVTRAYLDGTLIGTSSGGYGAFLAEVVSPAPRFSFRAVSSSGPNGLLNIKSLSFGPWTP